jgi:hypothetical protein
MATANPFELLGEGDDAPEALAPTVEPIVVEKKAVAKPGELGLGVPPRCDGGHRC